MWINALLPQPEIARQQAASARHFGPLGRKFLSLLDKFTVMLGEGTLHDGSGWLTNARLWRLILLQSDEGYWVRLGCPAAPARGSRYPQPRAAVPLRLRLLRGLAAADCAPSGCCIT